MIIKSFIKLIATSPAGEDATVKAITHIIDVINLDYFDNDLASDISYYDDASDAICIILYGQAKANNNIPKASEIKQDIIRYSKGKIDIKQLCCSVTKVQAPVYVYQPNAR